MNDRREPTISGLRVDPEEARPRARTQTQPAAKTVSSRAAPAGKPSASRQSETGRYSNAPMSSRPVVVKSPLAPIAMLVALVAVGAAGYLYWQLDKAQQTLVTSNERLLVLEEKLIMSGDESAASSVVLQASLKEAHAEIRKLWGVAYDRNRAAIANNKSLITTAHTKTQKAGKRIDVLAAEIAILSDLADAQQNALTSIERSNSSVLAQARQGAENNAKVERSLSALEQRITTSEEDIQAINGFRKTVNQQLQQLRGNSP